MSTGEKKPTGAAMKPSPFSRSRCLLSRHESRLFVIDVQEKFVPHLTDGMRLVSNCRFLIEGAKLLGIPLAVTEQNPLKLGTTVAELRELLPTPLDKMRFSSAECLQNELTAGDEVRRQIVICGIETHVCIMQTALDLLSQGWDIYVVADAVQSRYESDRSLALDRMAAAGVTLVSVESALFEWCETAEAAEFRDISRLVKARAK